MRGSVLAGFFWGILVAILYFQIPTGASGQPTEIANSNQEKPSWYRVKNDLTPIITKGSSERREIALTFDDGPHPVYTMELLSMLHEYNIHATFFVLGERVKLFPWTLQKIAEAGHEIGNHSYTHPSFLSLSDERIRSEIEKTQQIIESTTGHAPTLFRPPYGSYHLNTREICDSDNLEVVLWSLDSEDWRHRDEERVYEDIISQVHNGSIILCHDIHRTTIEAMPRVIETLLKEGYQFRTVSELIQLKTQPSDLASHRDPIRND